MHKTLRLRWPQTDSASQVSRYAKALEARLLELGVNYLQGYLIGKPQPLDECQAKKSRALPGSDD